MYVCIYSSYYVNITYYVIRFRSNQYKCIKIRYTSKLSNLKGEIIAY